MSLSLSTSTAVVNAAIEAIGDNTPPVTGVAPNFDSSAAGVVAAALGRRLTPALADPRLLQAAAQDEQAFKVHTHRSTLRLLTANCITAP